LIKASGLQQIDLEHTNVHHELVVRQSTVDQISPIPLIALLHRPVFDRLVDWLGFVIADRTRWRPPRYLLNASDGCAWVNRRSS
jgi:hypothetical protein